MTTGVRRWLWAVPVVVFAAVLAGAHHLDVVLAVGVALIILIVVQRHVEGAVGVLVVVLPFNSVLLPLLYRVGLSHQAVQAAGLWEAGIIGGCLLALVRRRRSWRWDALDAVAAAYVVLGLAYLLVPGVFVHGGPGGSLSLYDRALGWRSDVSYIATFLVVRHLGLPREAVDRIVRRLLAVIAAAAAIGVFEALFSGVWNHFAVDDLGVTRYRQQVLGEQPGALFRTNDIRTFGYVDGHSILRIGSVLFDYIAIGFVFAIGLGLAAELAARGEAKRWVWLSMPLIGAALLLTQTRSAIIAGVIAVAFTLRPRPGKPIAARARFGRWLAGALVIVLPLVLVAGLLDRFTGAGAANATHDQSARATTALVAHHPLGEGLSTSNGGGFLVAQRAGGLDQYVEITPRSTKLVSSLAITESQYLEIAKELGLPGLALYLALLVLLILRLGSARAGRSHLPAAMGAVAVGVTIGLATIEGFVYFEVATLFWTLAGLAVGVSDHEGAAPGRGAATATCSIRPSVDR